MACTVIQYKPFFLLMEEQYAEMPRMVYFLFCSWRGYMQKCHGQLIDTPVNLAFIYPSNFFVHDKQLNGKHHIFPVNISKAYIHFVAIYQSNKLAHTLNVILLIKATVLFGLCVSSNVLFQKNIIIHTR